MHATHATLPGTHDFVSHSRPSVSKSFLGRASRLSTHTDRNRPKFGPVCVGHLAALTATTKQHDREPSRGKL